MLYSEKERRNNRNEAEYLTSSCHGMEKILVGYKTRGNLKYLREKLFQTHHCDMFEIIREIMSQLTFNKLFLSPSECFKVSFSLSNFDDAIHLTVSIGKGGGSTRLMINPINVRKPQSLIYLKLLYSFDGSKDSYTNLECTLKKRFDNTLEPLMNRLIISMVIEIDNNVHTVIFLNQYGRARFDSPTSLPKPTGICNDVNIYNIDNQPEEFHT